MSAGPTLTISIDRTGMVGDPDPLVMVGHDAGTAEVSPLGVTDYAEPAIQARVLYAPPSAWMHGDAPLAWSWQQSLLGFSVVPVGLDEPDGRLAVEELRAALSRLSFEVTVTVDGAPAETWTCTAGTVEPAGSRTLVNLRYNDLVWNVSVPAHPVRAYA